MKRLVVALTLVAVSTASTALAQTPPKDPSQQKLCAGDVATFLPAANKGDAHAMFCMGVKHSNGNQVPRDEVQATRWYIKAAEAGQPSGMFLAGIAFWSGRGIAKDWVEAYKWLSLSATFSADRKNHSALTARDGLTRVLSPEQITEAKKRESDWEKEYQKRKKS